MPIGDPTTPFLSFAHPTTGAPLVALVGRPVPGSPVPLEVFEATEIDLDEPRKGSWSPHEGVIVVGDPQPTTDERGRLLNLTAEFDPVAASSATLGRYLVIERDGSATLEADGSRHLEDGETLITPGFMDFVPAGERADALMAMAADDDAEGDRIADALSAEDHVLGSPTCRL